MKIFNMIILSIFMLFISHASAKSDLIVGKDQSIEGIPQSSFVNMWWQWAVSMSNNESPIRDQTGTKCSVNQAGPVWFLAGGYGSSKIHRKCSIPADKYIFFPVINMLYYPNGKYSNASCDSVKKNASLNNQYLISFKVEIDNQKFVNPAFFRIGSGKCFDLSVRMPSYNSKERVYPSATDGYWIMLKPLSNGKHRISFRAEYKNPNSAYGRMVQDIVYDINSFKQ